MTEKNTKDALLHRIANHLILNASFLNNLGLYHGKMGVVLFFAHYARYTNNSLYESFAEEILKEIYEEVNDCLPIYMSNGLCGIGWGLEYLKYWKFVGNDLNKVLMEVDYKVMQYDPLRVSDFSFETGLDGIVCYVLTRLLSLSNRKTPFDKEYLKTLQDSCERALRQSSFDKNKIAHIAKMINYANNQDLLHPCESTGWAPDVLIISRCSLSWKDTFNILVQ